VTSLRKALGSWEYLKYFVAAAIAGFIAAILGGEIWLVALTALVVSFAVALWEQSQQRDGSGA
jgi:uncharacterized membrane protein YjjP (DUF1212 family)